MYLATILNIQIFGVDVPDIVIPYYVNEMIRVIFFIIMMDIVPSNNVDHSRFIYFLLKELQKYDRSIDFESNFELIDVYGILDDESKRKLLKSQEIVCISNIRLPKATRLLPVSYLEILKENGINSKFNYKARPDWTQSNIQYEYEESGDFITLGVKVTIIYLANDNFNENKCVRTINIGYKALKNDIFNPINGLIIGE
ncbi:MAG: hypothetical protein IPJ13_09325 [Saprospiraceae bacterium]|jgi:hypothetical protein|nr:hypothetical protein [Saprospiraceae bacterium]